MKRPLVSIVCTNYNKGNWIADAIDSFLRQKTDFNYEILLIDDASTDESPDIIKEYTRKHSDKIRAFYNQKNLGITRTWKKVCKEAKGDYIARCDGDDYWIDDKKLQKQVNALQKNKESKWCCTDYDIVTPDKKIIHKSAVETGVIARPNNYEEMLATKGFTMASTWLVNTKLIHEVNSELNNDTADDTFNIQLDLFNKTKLTYLSDSTTVYRVNEGSDSKPVDNKVAKARDEKLLKTQLEYINKYPKADYKKIIEILLKQSIDSDDRLRLINRQNKHIENQEDVILDKDKVIHQKDKVIHQKDEQISAIINSKSYKIGKAVVSPVSKAKSIVKRRK